jgi:hypothetical protein
MIRQAALCLIVVFLSAQLHAQIRSVSSLKDSSLFKAKIKGHVVQLFKWTDKSGVNYLVLTETSEFKSKAKRSSWDQDCNEEFCGDKEIYAYHFLGVDSLLWRVMDHERACTVDLVAEFRRKATTITDLDKDGVAETWIMYSLTCTSDVSPRALKLIMHEGSKKYAIRGTSQPGRNFTEPEYGGKYYPDSSFAALPAVLKAFGKNLWNKNLYDLE